MNTFYQTIEQNASWQLAGILFVVVALFFLGFQWRKGKLRDENGQPVTTFDGRWSYTAEEGTKLLGDMGKGGRRTYWITQVSLDLFFPVFYTALMAVLLVLVYSDPRYLLLIPIVVLGADLLENATTVYHVFSFEKGLAPAIVKLGSLFTSIKWSGLYTGTVLIAGKVVYNIFNRFLG